MQDHVFYVQKECQEEKDQGGFWKRYDKRQMICEFW